jgi:hypothetical protein
MTIWQIDIERVRVVGADARDLAPDHLRALVAQAVQGSLESAPLPPGRTVRTAIEVSVPSLSGGASVAHAVARGVSRAIGGNAHG